MPRQPAALAGPTQQGQCWSVPEALNVSSIATGNIRTSDIDGDGRDDLICQLDATTWRVHLANGGISAPLLSNSDVARYVDLGSGISNPSNPVQIALADVDADGQTDLVFSEANGRWHVRKRVGPRSGLLVSVTDGLGNTWRREYVPLTNFAGYTYNGTDGTGQHLMRGGALHVVSKYTANDGAGSDYTMSYAYVNGRLSHTGRGFLGFEKVRATDSRYAAVHGVSVYTETVYRQDFPYIGLPDLVTTTRSDGRRISVLDPGWAVNTRAAAAGDPAADYHLVLMAKETSEDYETDPDGGALGQRPGPGRRPGTSTPITAYRCPKPWWPARRPAPQYSPPPRPRLSMIRCAPPNTVWACRAGSV